MARTFTGRRKVIKFEGAYHGMHDYAVQSAFTVVQEYPHGVPDSAGVPDEVGDLVLVARWNDLDMVAELIRRDADDIAALICEPVQRVLAPAPGFLEGLRELTREHGILLIFDEVVTGFRLALGGAQEHFGVTPDLATFGKALTNGLPIGCIAGRHDVISVADAVSRRAGQPVSLFGGTANGNPVVAAAALAVIDALSRAGTYERLWSAGETIRAETAKVAASHDIPVDVLGVGPMLQVFFTDEPVTDVAALQRVDRERARQWSLEVLRNGVLNGLGKMYLSTVHSETDLRDAVAAFDQAFAAVRTAERHADARR
jgi:glutamate-1-semialdehyde 2,1-aminomutase